MSIEFFFIYSLSIYLNLALFAAVYVTISNWKNIYFRKIGVHIYGEGGVENGVGYQNKNVKIRRIIIFTIGTLCMKGRPYTFIIIIFIFIYKFDANHSRIIQVLDIIG